MKYLAHVENSLESKIISIYDVIKGLNGKNPSEWEERTYYSLWYNTPMVARVNSSKRKPHFAFKKGFGGNENSGGGESIEHQLSKKVVSDLKCLDLKIGELSGKLHFSEVIIEQPFEDREYIADLYCRISNENEFNFPANSMIVIELHYTNKVKKSKEKFYRNHNLTAIEIDVWKKIKFEGDVQRLQRQLTGYFKKPLFAKRLHDPNWRKVVEERKRKEEIQKQDKVQAEKDDTRKEMERIAKRQIEVPEKKQKTIEVKMGKQQLRPPIKKKSIWQEIIDLILGRKS